MVDCQEYLRKALDPKLRKQTIELAVIKLEEHKDEFDAIVIQGYSSSLIGIPIADALGKPIVIVRKPNDDRTSNKKVEGLATTRFLFVDDLVSTGRTFSRVREALYEWNAATIVGVYLYQQDHRSIFVGDTKQYHALYSSVC